MRKGRPPRQSGVNCAHMKSILSLFGKLFLVGLVLLAILLVYLDALVSTTFSQRQWELPAKVYARPLELYPGRNLNAEELMYELRLLGYRPVQRLQAPGQFSQSGNQVSFYSRSFRFSDETVAASQVGIQFAGSKLSQLSVAGNSAHLFRLEPVQIGGIYPRHREDRLLLRLEEVPDTMRQALLAVEDRGFYSHWGVSLSGIARAFKANLEAGRVVQGGSTLTQQLVKNYYLSSERSVTRKVTEALMALLLELHFSKDAILEAYMNEVFLVQDGPRAVHGFGLASRFFFNRSVSELGLHQQALLVAMVIGPSLYNPLRNPERATERRNTVLAVMYREGVISDVEYEVARAMPLQVSRQPRVMNSYPAFLDLVRRQLGSEYRQEDLGSLGLGIFTSFDPLLQRQAESSVEKVLDRIDTAEQLETALVVTSFDNGEVRALVGGRSPRFAGFNRALDAVRPVGSLIKPAVYLTALADPARYTLATPLQDEAIEVEMGGGQVWSPRNFDRTSHGQVLLHEALSRSYNQATVALGMELGVERVLNTLEQLGVDRDLPAYPSLFLGAGGLSPVDVAQMYQTIATGGFRLPLRTIREVLDAHGEPLQRYALQYDRVFDSGTMHLLHYALREVVKEGTGRGVYRDLPADFMVAGKTGTTNDNRDSWYAGFSGDLMAVSWVGRDDNGETGLTGAAGGLRIWSDFMASASARSLAYRVPDGVEHFWIDQGSGNLSGKDCEGARLIPFISGSQPETAEECVDRRRGVMEWFQDLF